MSQIYTDKSHPISIMWLFRYLIVLCIGLLLFFLVIALLVIFLSNTKGTWDAVWLLFGPLSSLEFFPQLISVFGIIPIVVLLLQRINFHYKIDNDYLHIVQGVIMKLDERVAYDQIKEVFVRQTKFNRIFGLATLVFDVRVPGFERQVSKNLATRKGNKIMEPIGFSGNRVYIPGLKKKDAEEMKGYILQKIKSNK